HLGVAPGLDPEAPNGSGRLALALRAQGLKRRLVGCRLLGEEAAKGLVEPITQGWCGAKRRPQRKHLATDLLDALAHKIVRLDLGAPETIDRLLGVPHQEQTGRA